jgi:hypothetical protein
VVALPGRPELDQQRPHRFVSLGVGRHALLAAGASPERPEQKERLVRSPLISAGPDGEVRDPGAEVVGGHGGVAARNWKLIVQLACVSWVDGLLIIAS